MSLPVSNFPPFLVHILLCRLKCYLLHISAFADSEVLSGKFKNPSPTTDFIPTHCHSPLALEEAVEMFLRVKIQSEICIVWELGPHPVLSKRLQ